MSDDIKVGIGVDASGLKAGMGQIKKELDGLKAKTKDGFFDLEGEKRVERNLGSMVQGLANATSGAEALAIGLDRVENVFKSSLGASVAVAGITALISKIQEARAEYDKWIKQMEELQISLGRSIATGSNLPVLDDVNKRLKDIEDRTKSIRGFWGSIGPALSNIFGSGKGRKEMEAEMASEAKTLQSIANAAIEAEAKKGREQTLKAEKELNDKILEDDLRAVDDANKEYDKLRKERGEQEKKDREAIEKATADFAREEWKKYWQDMADAATAYKDKRLKDEAEFAEREKDRAALQDQLQGEHDKFNARVAEQEKQNRANVVAEELKSPGQRNDERNAARQAANEENRAIRRAAQKEQDRQNRDWRNARMTDKDKEAWAKEFKAKRDEDKRPEFEKDIGIIRAKMEELTKKLVAR